MSRKTKASVHPDKLNDVKSQIYPFFMVRSYKGTSTVMRRYNPVADKADAKVVLGGPG